MYQQDTPLNCPACGALQTSDARICHVCNQPLIRPRHTRPRLYRGTLWVMWTLFALLTGVLMTSYLMAANGAWPSETSYGLTFIWLTFSLTHLMFWLQVRNSLRRAADFLASDRPLVRWTYTDAEWQVMRDTAWEAARTDWKLPLGCLPVLFGVTGLLIGLLVGLEDGGEEAIIGALVGGLAGAAVGGVLGVLAVGINYVSARRAYNQTIPAEVALGKEEIYYGGHYLKDGLWARIERVAFTAGPPPRLIIESWASRYRIERGFIGEIDVPPRMIPALTDVVPRMQGASPWTEEDEQSD